MKISVNTNWLLLMLLVFTGQTLSVPLSNHNDCQMDHSSVVSDHSMPKHDMGSMSGQDRTMMDMSNMEMTMDCCGDECQCSDGLCSSTVYFSKLDNKLSIVTQSTVLFVDSQFTNIQRSSSIYRPPILS